MSDDRCSGSCPLPQRPSLEHLRNEAKALLRSRREADPGIRLADAQRAVARRYGFASWRRLKAHVNAAVDMGGALVEAVRRGDLAIMDRVLAACPSLVDAAVDLTERIRPSDERAMRLIHLAVAENQPGAARLLIERGAAPDLRNAGGRTALHDCFELNRTEIKDLLIEAGAEVDICAAAAYGMVDVLERILADDPSRANDLSTGMTPLAWAAYGRSGTAARRLIAAGAIVDRPPYDACNWAAAAHVASTDVALEFLAAGADPDCADADGATPLHLVVTSRLVRDPADFVAALLAAGANPARHDAAQRAPLDVAFAQRNGVSTKHETGALVGVKAMRRTIDLLRAANDVR